MRDSSRLGGTLDPETLISAYRAGIFPWSSDPVISWWSPDPRAIFDLDELAAAPQHGAQRAARRVAVHRRPAISPA